MSKITELSEHEFNQAVQSESKTVLIDFYSPSCTPCAQIMPVLDDLNKKHLQIDIYKIDVNKSNGLSAQYNIMTLPTLLFFKNGKVIGEAAGSVTLPEIEKKLNAIT